MHGGTCFHTSNHNKISNETQHCGEEAIHISVDVVEGSSIEVFFQQSTKGWANVIGSLRRHGNSIVQ